jgi:hypothetical protein
MTPKRPRDPNQPILAVLFKYRTRLQGRVNIYPVRNTLSPSMRTLTPSS